MRAFAMIEVLEDRALLSAAPVAVEAGRADEPHAAALHVGKSPEKSPAKAKAKKGGTTRASIAARELTGTWTGTAVGSARGAKPAAVTFAFGPRQANETYRLTLNFGKLLGKGAMATTVTFKPGASDELRALATAPGVNVSVTSAVSADGTTIVGRWCAQVGTKWVVGTVTLTKAA